MRINKKGKRIIVLVAGALVVLSLIALLVSVINTNKLRNEIAVKQLEMLTERTELENRNFFKELTTSLNTISGLIKNRVFTEADLENWSLGIGTVLESNSNIAAVSIVNKDESEFYVSLSDSVLGYYFIKDKNESSVTYYSRVLSSESPIHVFDTVAAARTINLISYKNQLTADRDSVVWYGIQSIPGVKNRMGFAASVKKKGKEENEELIISIYVSLETLNNLLKSNANIVNADLFMFTENREYVNFESDLSNSEKANFSDYLIELDKVEYPLYQEAMLNWDKNRVGDSAHFQTFKYNGNKYWGAFRVTQRGNQKLWIALIVAEKDFSMILKGEIGLLFFSSIFVMLLSALILYITLRRNFLRSGTKDFSKTEDVIKLIKKGENEFTEFKSTVRMNLFSQKPGKEIELAWLKSVVAFCNTNGGTILIGVNDDGEILGLDADKFPNDDKFLLHVQSLLKDHVGMEFSNYINYKLHECDNKKFLAVHCTPSQKPLFLIANNNEKFYVRSGPASIELSTSKALKYIEDRKKDN